jgi:dTDP-4-dehydrorhamnose 3,5-epimerase
MKVSPAAIPEVLILEPEIFADSRGFFFESFNQRKFNEAVGHAINFVQDNHSRSLQGVIRGLHYQYPKAQGKLVRVVTGSIFSVAVDLRVSSERLGQWIGIELSAENQRQVWIPPGFAHGFMATTKSAECLYKVSDYYDPECEHCITWNDEKLNIAWPHLSGKPALSTKDQSALRFDDAPLFDN